MANKNVALSGTALAVIAIVAGIMVLFWWDYARFIIGIFLIVWGILSLMKK
jgi:hypothetical protein